MPSQRSRRSNLGHELNEQRQFDEAIAEYREAIRFAPDYAMAQLNLGNALVSQGKFEEAIAAYCEAIRLDPNNATSHNGLGNALGSVGRLRKQSRRFARPSVSTPMMPSPTTTWALP